MGDYYCNICYKSIKLKNKKKQLNTKSHKFLSESIINKYCIRNPELIEVEQILRKHVNYYNKRFEVYGIICEWKLVFTDTTIRVKSKILYNKWIREGLIGYSARKIQYFRRQGFIFPHISEMSITFTAKFCNMTYEHYLEQPKCMLEWKLNEKLYKNPEPVRRLDDLHITLNMGSKQVTRGESDIF